MKTVHLDAIDKKILTILQKDARTPVKDIAHAVYLSSPYLPEFSVLWTSTISPVFMPQ